MSETAPRAGPGRNQATALSLPAKLMFKGGTIGASRHFEKISGVDGGRARRHGGPKDRAASGDKAEAIAKAAKKLREVMQQKNPNRRTDGGKIVLNGKTYVRKQILAVGGMGMVERFTEEHAGKTVIVKQVKFSGMKEQFVGEARAHWQVSGGGSVEGDPHAMKMDGAAVDDRGNLSTPRGNARPQPLPQGIQPMHVER
jgi:hypothetical protein